MNKKPTDDINHTEELSSTQIPTPEEAAAEQSTPEDKVSAQTLPDSEEKFPEEAASTTDESELTAEKAVESSRPSDYALPNTDRREHSKKSDLNGKGWDKKEADDFIYTHYHRVKKRTSGHHVSTKQELPKEDDVPLVLSARRRRSSNSQNGKSSETSEEVQNKNAVEYAIPKKKKKRKNSFKHRPLWQKFLIISGIILGAILGLILILAATFIIMYFIGRAQLTDYTSMDMTAPVIEGAEISVGDKGKTVTYKGKEYIFNSDITSILCMGVDKNELGLDWDIVGTGGQTDAIYLIAFNTKTGVTDVFAIPRDVMTDIEIYNTDGKYVKTEKHQLCLAYAYGDGKEKSCEITKTSVERLFYNLPIHSYFSMDIEAIADLNDAVGGVTVTMTDDLFVDIYGVRHYKGETFTLYGDNATLYLRSRNITELNSTTDRMNHQINYLNAFSQKVIAMTNNDLGVPLNLLSIISDNSVTNLNAAKITAFATTIVTNGINELNFKSVPGELTSDGTYAQYIVDEDSFYQTFLDVYYTPVA